MENSVFICFPSLWKDTWESAAHKKECFGCWSQILQSLGPVTPRLLIKMGVKAWWGKSALLMVAKMWTKRRRGSGSSVPVWWVAVIVFLHPLITWEESLKEQRSRVGLPMLCPWTVFLIELLKVGRAILNVDRSASQAEKASWEVSVCICVLCSRLRFLSYFL